MVCKKQSESTCGEAHFLLKVRSHQDANEAIKSADVGNALDILSFSLHLRVEIHYTTVLHCCLVDFLSSARNHVTARTSS